MSGCFRFLGTGASTGIPVIGCSCPICLSDDPKNKRLRTSGLLTWNGTRLLVDVGPDFRQQALRALLGDVDGVLMTHPHYDHIGGVDELRALFLQRHIPLPCVVSDVTHTELARRYDYLFRAPKPNQTLRAQLDFSILEGARGQAEFIGLPLQYFTVSQGGLNVTGFRVEQFAYLSDICQYPETIFDDLRGVETLVVSALRFESSHVHFSVDQAVAFAERVGARQTWLVHMGHELDHSAANDYLPEGIALAYDQLEIAV